MRLLCNALQESKWPKTGRGGNSKYLKMNLVSSSFLFNLSLIFVSLSYISLPSNLISSPPA